MGEPRKPEKPETKKDQLSYEETLLKTESAEQRDSRTEALLSEMSTISPRDFVSQACEILGIPKPGKNEKLAPKVIAIQRKLGFPEEDNPLGIDGKMGSHTFGVLLAKYEQLRQFDKRRQAILASQKEKRGQLQSEVEAKPHAQAPAPSAKPAESKDRTPVSANEVALIGDSLTYGYRRFFNVNGEKVPTATDKQYVKVGKSALAMLNDFNKLNNAGKLDNIKVLVLFGGANDLSYRTSAEIVGYLEAMRQVMLAKKPPARVVLVTLPPVQGYLLFGKKRELCEKRVKEVNEWIRKQAGGNTSVVDLYNMIADPNKDGHMQRQFNGGDGLHLSGKAYKKLAEAVQKAVV
jgi:lysophospholipase L1-like esterase